MKNRSELRESIIKILYQVYLLSGTKYPSNIDELISEELEVDNEFVKKSINDIILYQNELDTLANKYLVNWEIGRLSKVDHAIFSLGIYELLYTDTPSVVAINEAIELAKKYSDDSVVKMLNGVLDNIYHSEDKHE